MEFRRKDYNRQNNSNFNKERKERPQAPPHELIHSTKIRAGKRRTYFFDVRRTQNDDHYLTITESTKKFNGGYERHKIFLYKEDFNRFMKELNGIVEHIKTEIMPDYDYDEYERRQLEWEERRASGEFDQHDDDIEEDVDENDKGLDEKKSQTDDDDISW